MERQFAVAQPLHHYLDSTVMVVRHRLSLEFVFNFVGWYDLSRRWIGACLLRIVAVEDQQPLQETHIIGADSWREL